MKTKSLEQLQREIRMLKREKAELKRKLVNSEKVKREASNQINYLVSELARSEK